MPLVSTPKTFLLLVHALIYKTLVCMSNKLCFVKLQALGVI